MTALALRLRPQGGAIVAELRKHAQDSESHVRAFTRMYGEGAAPVRRGRD